MKIAISMSEPELEADIEPRFGRCPYFIRVDPETMEFEAIKNSSAGASGGAGVSAAQMISGQGVEAVLTGRCGPNALEVLTAARIKVITGVYGKARDAIEAYKSGKFQTSTGPNTDAKTGISINNNPGVGAGPGRGMGRGRSMGRRGNTQG
ncbi:NifB/NifX family molybdenum-iron cluster-binding protein [Chloroflexota bacterium]